MQDIKIKIERCEVSCEYCTCKYSLIVDEDEIPVICIVCGTPSLRVVERHDTDYYDRIVSID